MTDMISVSLSRVFRDAATSNRYVQLFLLVWGALLATPLLSSGVDAEEPAEPTTRVSIRAGRWCINDCVTYAGAPAEGLLMNVRMVNSVFEDRRRDDFDPEANTDRFLSHVPDYAAQGVRAFTIGLQGGMPGYEGALNSAFHPDGSLRESYLRRVRRVIDACDRQGVVVILGCFYQRQDQVLADEAAVRRGLLNVVDWIDRGDFQNVVLEVANEFDHPGYDHRILRSVEGQLELIRLVKKTAPDLLVSTSGLGHGRYPAQLAEAADFILIHFNGTKVEDIPGRIAALEKYGKPIVCNEDDKQDETAARAAEVSVANGASWGLMLNQLNQYFPLEFHGAADDPVVYRKLKNLTLLPPKPVPPIAPDPAELLYVVQPLEQEVAEKYKLDPAFYKKNVTVQNILIATSDRVSDFALREAAYQFDEVMSSIQPQIAQRIRDKEVLCILIGQSELTSQLPQFKTDKTGLELDFYNWRQRGFLTRKDGRPTVVFAEEDVLEYEGGMQDESILIHEFGHVIDSAGFDDQLRERLTVAFENAKENRIWQDGRAAQRFRRVKSKKPVLLLDALAKAFPHQSREMLTHYLDGGDILVNGKPTNAQAKVSRNDKVLIVFGGPKDCYASKNRAEYWAEGVQCWYDTNRTMDHDHNHIHTRDQLKKYDPMLAALCKEVLGNSKWRFVSPRTRAGQGHLKRYKPAAAPKMKLAPHIQDAANDYYDKYWRDYWQRLEEKYARVETAEEVKGKEKDTEETDGKDRPINDCRIFVGIVCRLGLCPDHWPSRVGDPTYDSY